ncbi:hypothetical protein [Arcanobacterium phocae]|uniref:hypothetical protein n=1 Tax=Arcanobacterium phocae TaxID=131112 RepID=UPI001C0EE626|nr:hypothetical protein [Arcanobacterium phocae]
MDKYLRNEAIGEASLFTIIGVWRSVVLSTNQYPFYLMELVVWLLLVAGLIMQALAYRDITCSARKAIAGITILAFACGVACGSVLLAWSNSLGSAGELQPDAEVLILAAVSLLGLFVWLYRTLRYLHIGAETSRLP